MQNKKMKKIANLIKKIPSCTSVVTQKSGDSYRKFLVWMTSQHHGSLT
ncbi:unnamed protein product [Chironomus riparius]|uniref:Uncharacterized protein n=1 Tax=Chironomus riparius TaxID=315576 RepID=A0A9N9RJE3_9DIPT|nr:unnamed protein product [Chironomus riparius]